MLKVIIPSTTIISLFFLIILLNTTSPATVGLFGILAIFSLSYIVILGLLTYFIHIMSRVISHLSLAFISRRPFEVLTIKRSYYFSTVIAAAPIMVVGLQSVAAVGFYEIILIFIFVIIGCLYISKRVK